MARRASTGSMPGSAARRRPSLDWPLSRDEKKSHVMRLFEKDVQSANQLLESQEEALEAVSQELSTLRRLSSGRQSEASEGDSALNAHGLAQTFDDVEAAIDAIFSKSEQARGEAGEPPESLAPRMKELPERREKSSPRLRRRRKSTGGALRNLAVEQDADGTEPTSHWWAPVFKSVWKGAQKVTETAAEVSRALADEARLLADEALLFAGETRSDAGRTGPSSEGSSNMPKTEYMEWRVELELPRGELGLELDGFEKPQVMAITEGLAIDFWNTCKLPVTVLLYPGRREVVRRWAVLVGDELIATDGESIAGCDVFAFHERMNHSQALTFRRRVNARKEVSNAAKGGA